MKFKLFIFVALCLLNVYGECKWKPESEHDGHHEKWTRRETANEITPHKHHKKYDAHHTKSDPPDHTKLLAMARYTMHNGDWASVATISVLPAIQGFPFVNVKSIADGYRANSTGVPYFYMSPLDLSARDLTKNSRSSVLISLEETGYCAGHNIDPEDPRCTRLMLTGKMKKVKEGSPEYTFAKGALFERHPSMADFPPDHNWFVAKLKIAQIAMVDWFGGAKYLSVKDYLAFNYTNIDTVKFHRSHPHKDLSKA